MPTREFIDPPDIYRPTWQFSHAIRISGGDLLVCSGIVGLEPDGTIARGDIVRQAEVAFDNLRRVTEAAGGSLRDIVKLTVYLGEDFRIHRDQLREIRARHFTEDFPASTLVQAAGFASPDYLIEIDALAVIG